jgi:elongator complex protein 1
VATQFKGSAGQASDEDVDRDVVSVDEDESVQISWRGDAEHFAVSTVDSDTHSRRIRFYARTGDLEATSEELHGLASPLAWQPSGALVATAKSSHPAEIVFFERLGLRRSSLPIMATDLRVLLLSWDPTSTLLAVCLAGNDDVAHIGAQVRHMPRSGADDSSQFASTVVAITIGVSPANLLMLVLTDAQVFGA